MIATSLLFLPGCWPFRVGRWPYRKHNSVHSLMQVVQQHGLDTMKQEDCNRVCLELQ
jgi:hypothetical protein